MKKLAWLLVGTAQVLASCEQYETGGSSASGQYIGTLPEGVIEIAAPHQDLKSVQIDPVDGCYVYRHAGPVETTFLPLRSKSGQPICSRAPEPA
ncbi:hypothetical protein DS909_23155 [Phaeobacter gallaeciensis]|uniref:Lipoprotein n=2 Tax=Roseobacteraceae TaxID=2854170 RepID=A0A366WJN7_9RHOB|nr:MULTISPECIES: hypothetical protein [Roseobacteraceae]MBT3143652.1 hypothetical protein [Falsiruegeria litorea]MBT8167922.1 hypothetical protein [Falsiruegeria litorea]RBW49586.1 hypothetical protein DS909_23155 [Phaeobacter gallaeciensis]